MERKERIEENLLTKQLQSYNRLNECWVRGAVALREGPTFFINGICGTIDQEMTATKMPKIEASVILEDDYYLSYDLNTAI